MALSDQGMSQYPPGWAGRCGWGEKKLGLYDWAAAPVTRTREVVEDGWLDRPMEGEEQIETKLSRNYQVIYLYTVIIFVRRLRVTNFKPSDESVLHSRSVSKAFFNVEFTLTVADLVGVAVRTTPCPLNTNTAPVCAVTFTYCSLILFQGNV